MRVRLAAPRKLHHRRPLGLYRYRRDDTVLPAGLHLNRLGDRPGGHWPPTHKGRHIIGCWLKVGDRCLSWVWPIRFEVDR